MLFTSRLLYFNSIKVRLELPDYAGLIVLKAEFQFHKGTIRTGADLKNVLTTSNFNSIKVRLEPSFRKEILRHTPISIP